MNICSSYRQARRTLSSPDCLEAMFGSSWSFLNLAPGGVALRRAGVCHPHRPCRPLQTVQPSRAPFRPSTRARARFSAASSKPISPAASLSARASFANAADVAVAGLDPQRDAGSRGARPHLRPAHQRRPAADPAGPRFFVDALLEFGGLAARSGRASSDRRARPPRGGYEGALAAHDEPSVRPHPRRGPRADEQEDVRLSHIEFVRVEAEKALAVLVAEDGAIENRIVAIPPAFPPPP